MLQKAQLYILLLISSVVLVSGCVSNAQESLVGPELDVPDNFEVSEISSNQVSEVTKVGESIAVLHGDIDSEEYEVYYQGESSDYGDERSIVDLNGELGVLVRKGDEEAIIEDEEQITQTYDHIIEPKMIGDRLCFAVKRNGGQQAICDGENISGVHDEVSIYEIEGQPAVYTEGSSSLESNRGAIIYEGEKYGENYEIVGRQPVLGLNGKPVYLASENSEEVSYGPGFIVHGNERMTEKYSRDSTVFIGEKENAIEKFTIVGDEVYFVVENGSSVLMRDDEQVSPEGVEAGMAIDVGGEPAYEVEEDGKRSFIYRGERYGNSFDQALAPTDIGGELVYIASREKQDGSKISVVHKGVEIGSFDSILKPLGSQEDLYNVLKDLNGRLGFVAKKGGTWYLVEEKV